MSVQAITWALGFQVENATEKAVLLVLANYADGDGVCWPGQESIAKQASCTDRTVRRVLDVFEARGLISRSHRQRRDGSRTSDEIRLTVFQPDSLSDPTGQPVRSNRTACPIQPDTVSALTTFEPLEDTSEEPSETRASARPRSQVDFDVFWEAYPAKVGKKAARKAWDRAKDRPPIAALLVALTRYRRAKPVDRDWCHPATWINQGRWDDDWAPDATGPPGVKIDLAEIEANRRLLESAAHA